MTLALLLPFVVTAEELLIPGAILYNKEIAN
jgi:hypothetical protein